MRTIVLRPTQLLDMQYLNRQVRLVLAASVGPVEPGDLVITPRYGHWQVRAVDPVLAPEATTISVIADLIEAAIIERPPCRDGRNAVTE
jgi:acyl dehydratase